MMMQDGGNRLPGPFSGLFQPQNGSETPLGPPSSLMMSPVMPSYSREDIVKMVDQHETDHQPLYDRMNGDFERYRLTTHTIRDSVSGQEIKGYAVYTSNAPRTYADKVISWLTLAELLIRVPHIEAGDHPEEADNLKERFAIGCLESANERLKRMLQPSLLGQQAFYVTVRGGYIGGRCLLAKNPYTGATYADIAAWDPMHIHWGIGPDGMDWACYKIKKTRAQIRREYGVDIGGGTFFQRLFHGSSDAEKEGIDVYDFYDGVVNTVVTDGETLKPPTPHGSPRVPVALVLVGAMPMLQSETAKNLVAEVGESVFAGAREVYEKYSDVMSIFLEIVERARKQTIIAESRDGKKTLPEDPIRHPTMIATATGDKVYTLELQKMAQETMSYVTQIMGEIQRATLPISVYGETPFQLSGYAITQLRQATETVLASRLEAREQLVLQMSNLLYDQFMTGAFEGMRLSGVDKNRKFFSQMITPDMLQGTCNYTVKFVSQLPQDDMSKWNMAGLAANFLSTQDILDNVIGIQDSQQAMDKKKLEMAERGLPEAVLYDLSMAAANRGETVLANIYLMEYLRLMAVKTGQMPPSPTDQGGRPNPPPQADGGGQRPEVMPRAATGAPPAPETSNQGPSFVAPNTPRPGARGQPS